MKKQGRTGLTHSSQVSGPTTQPASQLTFAAAAAAAAAAPFQAIASISAGFCHSVLLLCTTYYIPTHTLPVNLYCQ